LSVDNKRKYTKLLSLYTRFDLRLQEEKEY